MSKLESVEGIGTKYAAKLKGAGVRSLEALLKRGSTAAGRKDLAAKAGVSEKLVLEWVNRADLARIKGVGEEYADLLEASGVDTVPELAQRKAENLAEKMAQINKSKRLVRQLPSAKMVEKWIAQAKSLPRVVKY